MLWNNTPYDDLPKWKQFVRRELSLGSIIISDDSMVSHVLLRRVGDAWHGLPV